jgi:rare lipoprotein A (peptidoglycan hydrolase)
MWLKFIELAFIVQFSSNYGYSEKNCGSIGENKPCEYGAITASGETFDPELPTAAVFAPTKLKITPVDVFMQIDDGPCVQVRVNDKGNPRYIGTRAFDLSPKALELMTGSRSPKWTGRVKQCFKEDKQNEETSISTSDADVNTDTSADVR